MLREFNSAFANGLRPDPILTYDEWARDRFVLPPEAKATGLIDFSYVPYLMEPLQNFSWTSPVRQEFWMKGIQIAVTTFGEIILHANIDVFKQPLIMYFGSDDMASEFVKIRFDPGVENNFHLRGKIYDGYDKKNRSTIGLKILVGGIPMKFIGGISEKAYRHFSAAIILMDDVDSLPRDISGTTKKKGQGNPIYLALNRKNARMGDYKFACSGSPTDKETSLIYGEFKNTDQRYYNVECPFCGHLQVIDFWRIRPPKKTGKKKPLLECLDCNRLISEKYKFDMMQIKNGARWIPTQETDHPEIVGRQMSSAYSLLGYTWDEMCTEFERASNALKSGNPDLMTTFYNTKLGLPWDNKKTTEKISHSVLFESREQYPVVPKEAIILTAAIDVQGNRLEVLVVGHSPSTDIYCIEHKFIGGNTLIKYGQPGSPFDDLEKYLQSTFKNAFGFQQPILHSAIDMGFRSIIVSPFLKAMHEKGLPITGVFGGTGRSKKKMFVSDPIDNKYGIEQREINVDEGKTLISSKLKEQKINDEIIPKSIHFSEHPSFTEDFFRYLTAEVFNAKTQKWENPNAGRNEPLDLLNYNLAAFEIYTDGGHDKVDWDDFLEWNKRGCPEAAGQSGSGLISKGIDV